jgi:hypothetical protein
MNRQAAQLIGDPLTCSEQQEQKTSLLDLLNKQLVEQRSDQLAEMVARQTMSYWAAQWWQTMSCWMGSTTAGDVS